MGALQVSVDDLHLQVQGQVEDPVALEAVEDPVVLVVVEDPVGLLAGQEVVGTVPLAYQLNLGGMMGQALSDQQLEVSPLSIASRSLVAEIQKMG